METKKKLGVLSNWNELKGYGFVQARNPDGTRKSWFLHYSNIERIEEESGIPQPGAEVFFNEAPSPRGPLAIHAVVKSSIPPTHLSAGLKALSGKVGS